MESDSVQAEPGLHVRQAETDARPDQGLLRRADPEPGRHPTRVRRTRVWRVQCSRRLFDGRDWVVRVRAADELDHRERREHGVPGVWQDAVPAVAPSPVPGAVREHQPVASERSAGARLPEGRHTVLPRGIPRHHRVPEGEQRGQKRPGRQSDTGQKRSGLERQFAGRRCV